MNSFAASEKDAVYKAIAGRRDVRSGFLPDDVPSELISRVLNAAHQAPSVGFMQPWNFIVLKSREVRQRIRDSFLQCRAAEAENFSGSRRQLYDSLKLEGILESPLNICVTCDRQRTGLTGLGRSAQANMDLYSTVCAIQNLWLAARAEGLGVGWVSIIDAAVIREVLKLPPQVEVVAYLCVGFVEEFADKPKLETKGWQQRLEIEELIFFEEWGQKQ